MDPYRVCGKNSVGVVESLAYPLPVTMSSTCTAAGRQQKLSMVPVRHTVISTPVLIVFIETPLPVYTPVGIPTGLAGNQCVAAIESRERLTHPRKLMATRVNSALGSAFVFSTKEVFVASCAM